MAASLSYCPVCPAGKRENKRTSKVERRIYHKLLRRIQHRIVVQETMDVGNDQT
jgi:hypothetical protein